MRAPGTARHLALAALLLGTLALGACGSSSGGTTVVYDNDPWRYDYRYRSGIYGHHHDVDVDVDLPDRPRSRPSRPSGGRPGGGRGGGRR
jgi:hypothetical protein